MLTASEPVGPCAPWKEGLVLYFRQGVEACEVWCWTKVCLGA